MVNPMQRLVLGVAATAVTVGLVMAYPTSVPPAPLVTATVTNPTDGAPTAPADGPHRGGHR